MRNNNYRAMTSIVQNKAHEAHLRYVRTGLTGDMPLINFHMDPHLPPCVYQPKTNSMAVSLPAIVDLSVLEAIDHVLNAMAMCGCRRRYEMDLRIWNSTANRLRLTMPKMAMQGTALWRQLRGMLD